MYFAGSEPKGFFEALQTEGVKNVLVSAFSMNYKKGLEKHNEIFDKIFLDSGGYSARTRGVIVKVDDYAKYINENDIKIAFNLDTMSVEETMQNQKHLEKHTSSYIVPIYHHSDYVSKKNRRLLDSFIERYNYISIGGVAGMRLGKGAEVLYDYVFNKTKDKTKVHGLGITSEKILETYPFYSVDSTSWLAFCRYGNSCSIKDPRLTKFYNKAVHYSERLAMEIQHYLKMEKQITRLWDKRGVIFA
jgi:hypothetical protein